MSVISLSLPVHRTTVWRMPPVMPESHLSMPVMSPPMSGTSVHVRVSRSFVCQTSSFVSDSSLFMCQSSPMRRHITAPLSTIRGRVSLTRARLFHVIAVIPDITARITDIRARSCQAIRELSVMAARIRDTPSVLWDTARIR